MAWSLDVLADKQHPQFDTKILSKKEQLIRRCLQYTLLQSVHKYKDVPQKDLDLQL